MASRLLTRSGRILTRTMRQLSRDDAGVKLTAEDQRFVVASNRGRDIEYLTQDHQAKYQLYALFKQATEGPCTREKPAKEDDSEVRYKYKAWKSLANMSKEQAKSKYIIELNELLSVQGKPQI